MIDVRYILPVVLLGVCRSESVGQFTKYRIFNTTLSHNISASTMMTTIVGCDQFYSTRSTRTIVYHPTLQLCQLYEENVFPLMVLSDPSPPQTVYVKGSFYALVKTLMTWTDAKQNCEVIGGQLAKIESAEENEQILSWLRLYGRHPDPLSRDGSWTGLNDRAKEGSFSWADGSPLGNFRDWYRGNPDDFDDGEDCVEIGHRTRWWNDTPCSIELWSICEFD